MTGKDLLTKLQGMSEENLSKTIEMYRYEERTDRYFAEYQVHDLFLNDKVLMVASYDYQDYEVDGIIGGTVK